MQRAAAAARHGAAAEAGDPRGYPGALPRAAAHLWLRGAFSSLKFIEDMLKPMENQLEIDENLMRTIENLVKTMENQLEIDENQ